MLLAVRKHSVTVDGILDCFCKSVTLVGVRWSSERVTKE